MNSLAKAYYVLRLLGPGFVSRRIRLRARGLMGRTRRAFPATPWSEIDLNEIVQRGTPTNATEYRHFKRASAPAFLFPLGRPPEIPISVRGDELEAPLSLAKRIELLTADRCVYFFAQPAPHPIDWHCNSLDGLSSDPTAPWFQLDNFNEDQGDIRTLWEPSRAAWAIDLARGRAHGLQAATGELFWRWCESWLDANPPWQGINWACGQEATVRMMALMFGFWAFANDDASTPRRYTSLLKLAWATAHRIELHMEYAVSQKNNHALSEACGLILIAHLFPELRSASRWSQLGRRVFSQQLRQQIYDDGSYVQHSMNYHRVMLHVSLLALRIGELGDQPFERDLYDRIGLASHFVFQMMDHQSGRLPNYGHNDGANVLPLSDCEFSDFRPVLQSTHFLVHRERLLPPGPWDEEVRWLFGENAPDQSIPATTEATGKATAKTTAGAASKATSCDFRDGGYYTIRKDQSWAMMRCHTFRDRPSQYDQLHVDLWWQGINVLRDCGTDAYFSPYRPDLEWYFKSSAAHNTIEIGGGSTAGGDTVGGGALGGDPLELVSRFLWLPWPRAALRHFAPTGALGAWMEGERYDHERKPWRLLHRRAVVALKDDVWVIIDDLFPKKENTAVVRWHLVDAPYEVDSKCKAVRIRTKQGPITVSVAGEPSAPTRFEVVRGRDEPGDVQGYASTIYHDRSPIPVIQAEFPVQQAQRIVTTFCPGEAKAAKLVARSDRMQRWEVGPTGDNWIVEMAIPTRSARRILFDSHGLDT